MLRFFKSLFQQSTSGCKRSAGNVLSRKPQRRLDLAVEVLEERLALSTTPYFQFLNVPASIQAGVSIRVEVVEGGNTNPNGGSATGTTTATLYLGAYGATRALGTMSLIDGIGFATVQVPTTPEAAYLDAVAGSIRGTAGFVVTPGPLTHLIVNAPSQATAGTPFQVTVKAEDAFGNTVTADNQAPTLTASSGAVSGFTWSNGVGTATVTQNTAGSMTLTGAAGSLTSSASISVIPALATHFEVGTQGSTQTAAGAISYQLQILALDANGNHVTNFNQTPTITAGNGFPVTLDSISWADGYGFASVTLVAPGTTTLTVTAGSVTGTCNITVMPGASTNWSGYKINPGSAVTAVGGTWVQPAATGVSGAMSAIWVGIDGWGSGTVEQCGTDAYMGANGKAQYYAWYELFGDQTPSSQNPTLKGPDFSMVTIPNFAVQPGDTISAEVSLVPTTTRSFVFNMTDRPANGGPLETFSLVQTTQYVTPQRSSAEWIVEDPGKGSGGLYPLANFGQVTFTGAWAETGLTGLQGPTIGSLYSFTGAQALDMVKSGAPNTIPATIALTGGATISNTLGYLEPAAGVSSSSFTVAYVPASGVAKTASSALSPTTGGSSNRGVTAVVDTVFAHEALDGRPCSTAAVDALFALDWLGRHHRDELFG
jgi:hypothetical protein